MYIALSPGYSVRNENHCSYLIVRNGVLNRDNQGFIAYPIPPFMGYILEEIGMNELEKSEIFIAERLRVSKNSIHNFITQLLDHKNNKRFRLSDKASTILPGGVLIESATPIEIHSKRDVEFNPLGSFIEARPSMPFSINLMITNQCTADCIYCYANRALSPILSTNLIMNLITEMHDEGIVNLTITGGDVFTRKDWPQILRYAKEMGYRPFLSTKTPLSIVQLDCLKDIGYTELQFSLDSIENDVLRKMIRVGDDYLGKVEDMLRHCDEIGISILVRSVLTNLNGSDESIETMYHFLSKFECIKEWAITPAFFSEYKQKEYKKYEISNESLKSVYTFSKRTDLKFKIMLNKINQNGYQLKKSSTVEDFVCENQICMANTTSLSILSNGICSVCEMLYDHPEFILGDITKDTIKNVWNSKKALYLYNSNGETHDTTLSPCLSCSVIDNCKKGFGKRICYVDIAKTGGNPNSPDPRCPKASEYDIIL